MGQRNYVAKYAQRSGAGKHSNKKEKRMSYAYQEDWVHIDSHNEEIDRLEAEIKALEETVENADYDEAFILAELIELRWRYSDYKDMYQELEGIIKLHSDTAVHKALGILANKFTRKTTPEEWEITWLRG